MQLSLARIAAPLLLLASGCGYAQERPLIPTLERLAKNGNPEAIYFLGMAYQTGSGVAEDHAKALDAFRKAAELGDPLANYKLGCYYGGQGAGLLTLDPKLALKYKLVAAEAGYALAQQDVGVLYIAEGNPAAGLPWLKKSAAQGWSGGLMALASAYNGAAGTPKDAAKTAAYFRLLLMRSDASDEQRRWLDEFEKRLSPGERERAARIVRDYQPTPTPLTIKALSGQRAAEALVRSAPQP